MTAQTVFQFKKMLQNIDQCMVKAAAFCDHKKVDTVVLANSRLAPDMFPLIKQIQSACDAAKFCAAYLSGQTAPKHEDVETTWPELRERIAKVVKYLDGFKASDFAASDSITVKPGWAQGKWLTGAEYLNEVSVPNFYFHAMAVYAILRNNGVDIGKMDWLGSVNMKD